VREKTAYLEDSQFAYRSAWIRTMKTVKYRLTYEYMYIRSNMFFINATCWAKPPTSCQPYE